MTNACQGNSILGLSVLQATVLYTTQRHILAMQVFTHILALISSLVCEENKEKTTQTQHFCASSDIVWESQL